MLMEREADLSGNGPRERTVGARYDRRRFLRDMTALGCGATGVRQGNAAGRRLKFVALGQAAIQHDLREHPYDEYGRLARLLRGHDVCFTDLETVIDGPGAGPSTRKDTFFKAAPASVLECLADFSVNVLALSNNHSWDLNTGGILSTLNAVRQRGFALAGTGGNLAEATGAGYRDTPAGTIALVSMASGAIREGAAATESRAGVNEVRLEGGELNAEDTARNLDSIRGAAQRARHVFVYQHNHYWESNFRDTPGWQRRWARQCIDAGACAFVSHGAPLLQGIELYRGCPIFYDLGSFVFHSRTPVGYYPPEVWESVIAACVFDSGRLVSLELTPVLLNESGLSADNFFETRGRPVLARGAAAGRILARLQRISPRIEIRRAGDAGRVIV
jgi:poly-gamma-glutamate synthesis protein (capsule biosynthesis protein)